MESIINQQMANSNCKNTVSCTIKSKKKISEINKIIIIQ